MFLFWWCLGIWVWEDCNYQYGYYFLPLLSGCFIPFFLLSLWFLGVCGGCVLPGRKFCWDSARCGHCAFLVKCVSKCWKLTLKNENCWWVIRGSSQEKIRAGCFTTICLVSWERGQIVRRGHNRHPAAGWRMRLGNVIYRIGGRVTFWSSPTFFNGPCFSIRLYW